MQSSKGLISGNFGLILIIALYGISLAMPAIVYDAHMSPCTVSSTDCLERVAMNHSIETYKGLDILLSGGFGIFVSNFAWFANVLFLIAILNAFGKKYTSAIVFSLGALALGLQAFTFTAWPLDEGSVMKATLIRFEVGYYLWLTSFLVLGLYSLIKRRRVNRIS
jgi:hypothetical protein